MSALRTTSRLFAAARPAFKAQPFTRAFASVGHTDPAQTGSNDAAASSTKVKPASASPTIKEPAADADSKIKVRLIRSTPSFTAQNRIDQYN